MDISFKFNCSLSDIMKANNLYSNMIYVNQIIKIPRSKRGELCKMAKNYNCWVFECRKCGHLVFLNKKETLKKMFEYICPECNEKFDGNWILVGEGNGETFVWERG